MSRVLRATEAPGEFSASTSVLELYVHAGLGYSQPAGENEDTEITSSSSAIGPLESSKVSGKMSAMRPYRETRS